MTETEHEDAVDRAVYLEAARVAIDFAGSAVRLLELFAWRQGWAVHCGADPLECRAVIDSLDDAAAALADLISPLAARLKSYDDYGPEDDISRHPGWTGAGEAL